MSAAPYGIDTNFNGLPVLETPQSSNALGPYRLPQISDQVSQASNSMVTMEQARAMRAFSQNQSGLLVIIPEMEGGRNVMK